MAPQAAAACRALSNLKAQEVDWWRFSVGISRQNLILGLCFEVSNKVETKPKVSLFCFHLFLLPPFFSLSSVSCFCSPLCFSVPSTQKENHSAGWIASVALQQGCIPVWDVFCRSHQFPPGISRWPACRQCLIRRRSVLLYWNISCCPMQNPIYLKQHGENTYLLQGKPLVGKNLRKPVCQPWPRLHQDLRTRFPTWIPLPWALIWYVSMFVQTTGWRKLCVSQPAKASPGYVLLS